MMNHIEKWENGHLRSYPGILEALGICPGALERISVAGGGGKTSLIKYIAREYKARKIPVAVTTTTHMYAEKRPDFLLDNDREKMEEILKREGILFLGRPAENGKMQMPDKSGMEALMDFGCPVLIEADGARHMPMKAPGKNEPVFVEETGRVLYVYGLDGVGRPLKEVCFRPHEAARILGKGLEELVLPSDIARLALHEEGARKQVADRWKFALILNKTDMQGKRETAREICEILQKSGYKDTILCLGNTHLPEKGES